jgi:hypothetical protein
VFDAVLKCHGWSADQASLDRAAREAPLDAALILALELAGEPAGPLEPWKQAMQAEARRRLYPQRFGAPDAASAKVAEAFFPLAETALAGLDPDAIAARLPFRPLAEDELLRWPSGEEYRRLLEHLEREGFLVTLAMAQHWQGLTIQDHVLGVTGLALWIGRQLAQAIPVDLPRCTAAPSATTWASSPAWATRSSAFRACTTTTRTSTTPPGTWAAWGTSPPTTPAGTWS